MQRLANFEHLSQRVLFFQPASPDKLDKRSGATIANWRLVPVELNHGVINPHAVQRGENMLDRMNFYVAFTQRRGPFHVLHVLDLCVDGGFFREINPFKLNAVIDRGRFKRNHDLLSCMQRGSLEASRFCQRTLVCKSHSGTSEVPYSRPRGNSARKRSQEPGGAGSPRARARARESWPYYR